MVGGLEPPGNSGGAGSLSSPTAARIRIVSATDLMRLRYNPFHAYMEERIRQSLRRR